MYYFPAFDFYFTEKKFYRDPKNTLKYCLNIITLIIEKSK